ncbi:MAG: BRCT domain-containing protein [Sedimenticola sp.]
MAELHINLYFKHDNNDIHNLLFQFFATSDLNSSQRISDREEKELKWSAIVKQLNPERGQNLLKQLLKDFKDDFCSDELGSESIHEDSGYWVAHLVYGTCGDDITGRLVKFLYDLCPGVHSQAWGCGDDDPWEFWFKTDEIGNIVHKEDEPGIEAVDIYSWWHASMPESIKEGFMNEEGYVCGVDLEDQHVVFTGKMEDGTREEMEEMAEDYGAIIQKTINGKTTLLVVGDKPGKSKLSKAEKLDVMIINEEQFYASIEQ